MREPRTRQAKAQKPVQICIAQPAHLADASTARYSRRPSEPQFEPLERASILNATRATFLSLFGATFLSMF
jgi:hypothetical protein